MKPMADDEWLLNFVVPTTKEETQNDKSLSFHFSNTNNPIHINYI